MPTRKKTVSEILEFNLVAHATRLKLSENRVESLFSIFDQCSDDAHGKDDILRAIVVLSHATLEEALRLYKASALTHGAEEELNRVPLIGSVGRNPEKFFLGRLQKFKGRTVAAVIEASVIESVRKESYNSVDDIMSVVSLLKISKPGMDTLKSIVPRLQKMIQRRHRIAHEGDCIAQNLSLKLRPIKRRQVKIWSDTTFAVVAMLVTFVEADRARTLRKESPEVIPLASTN